MFSSFLTIKCCVNKTYIFLFLKSNTALFLYFHNFTSFLIKNITDKKNVFLPLPEMMLMFPERQISVFLGLEPNKRLPCPPPLLAQTQRHSALSHVQTLEEPGNILVGRLPR